MFDLYVCWAWTCRYVPLCVDADQLELLPTPVHDVADAEIEFATHDGCVGLSGQTVEMFETDAIDFVVDVETENGLVCVSRFCFCWGVFFFLIVAYHLIYVRCSFMITSIKSSTVTLKG